jgi:amino acid adenylation domain-containing protein
MVVGAPIAGRTRVELENLIGFFVNTLVLRTDLSNDPTFRELLGRVREVTLGAYAHQDMPFEKLVEELQPARDLSHNPLFQVMFVLQNTEAGDMPLDPQHNAPQFSVGTSRFDLTLCAVETSDGLMTVFEYNTNLFDFSTIISMSENFKTLLESAASDPERRISELLPLSEGERRQLIIECNQTAGSGAGAALIHELCESQAALRPEGVALTTSDGQLTYRELNSRANRLARYLRGRGVAPGVLVGLCAERSPEMVVGLLGILKAGGAFLPLDPAYPLDRLAYMLEDSRAPLLLTQDRLVGGLPAYSGEILRLDADWPLVANYADDDLKPTATLDDLAYVIYTSGSTGRPKGVMVPHRGVRNVAEAQARVFALGVESRVLQFASLNFDASVFEIVLALGAGAPLHLATQESILPGSPLIKVLRDERINILTIPPSSLAVLPGAALPDLHTLIVAGEACPAELVARWAHGRKFFNAYGPTEASIWATVAECADDQPTITIGRPILNTQVYVLDDGLEPVPVGVPGEMYIGGTGVTRGYISRPDLTAERFIPDPFATEPGARLYRTGDRARRLREGDIQFIGRVDYQLKLRGYRIEPGEIEASLLLHPEVREAAVLPRRSPSGETRLAAYYVSMPERSPEAAELRDFLRLRLPGYMIPATFSRLDALPLNGNGKLDRRALSAIGDNAALPADEPTDAPRNATEETLASIWREVLGVSRVGVNDDFFDHGGHSLLATRFVSRVNDAFDTNLALRRLFELPTIAALAEAVDAKKGGGDSGPQRPAIVPLARQLVKLPAAPESPDR